MNGSVRPRVSGRAAILASALLIVCGLLSGGARAAGLTAQAVPGSSAMFGVSCPTSTICWAVGESGSSGVVAEILNGVPQTASTVAGAGPLEGIACTGAQDCVAVGAAAAPTGGVVVPIVSGVAGTAQTIAAAGAGLYAVSCETETTCIAVGRSTYPAGIGDVVPIIDGVAGGAQQVANTSGLDAIDCYDTNDCTAVGDLLDAPTPPAVDNEAGEVVPISGTSAGTAHEIDNSDGIFAIGCPRAPAPASPAWASTNMTRRSSR